MASCAQGYSTRTHMTIARARTYIESLPSDALLWGGAAFSAAVCVGSILLFFLLPSKNASAEVGTAPILASASIRPLEVHVAADGLVLLRSARVVAAQGDTVVVSTAWGSADLRWNVRIDSNSFGKHNFGTQFLTRDGAKVSSLNLHAGQPVTITGMLDATAGEPTLVADSVRSLE